MVGGNKEGTLIPYFKFEFWQIAGFRINVWGLFVALGFLLAFYLACRWAKKEKLVVSYFFDIALIVLVGSLVGARLAYLLFYAQGNWQGWYAFWDGGMAFSGGFIASVLGIWVYLVWRKVRVWQYLDILATVMGLGYAVGRVGCFLVHDHLGKETGVPWGIKIDGVMRQEPSLYSVIVGLVIFGIVCWLRRFKLEGLRTVVFIMLFGAYRFGLDFLRSGDTRYGGLTFAQYMAAALVIIGVLLGVLLVKRIKNR